MSLIKDGTLTNKNSMGYASLVYVDEVDGLLKVIEDSLEDDKMSDALKTQLQEILYTFSESMKNDLTHVKMLDVRELEKDSVIHT